MRGCIYYSHAEYGERVCTYRYVHPGIRGQMLPDPGIIDINCIILPEAGGFYVSSQKDPDEYLELGLVPQMLRSLTPTGEAAKFGDKFGNEFTWLPATSPICQTLRRILSLEIQVEGTRIDFESIDDLEAKLWK